MANRGIPIEAITRRPDGAYVLVLVEQGPWNHDAVNSHMRRIQQRLNDCLSLALFGGLAAAFPETAEMPVIVRLDCYDTPDANIRELVERFATAVSESSKIQDGLLRNPFVSSIAFEYNWRTIGPNESTGDAS